MPDGFARRFGDWLRDLFRGKRGDGRPFAHPYYWSGFVYTGI
jgi:CHAT domain-containing protein